MIFTKATEEQTEQIIRFYLDIVSHLKATVNYPKWHDGHPCAADVENAVKSGTQYICTDDGALIGAVILSEDPEGYYEAGNWTLELSRGEYLIIHALAVHSEKARKGIGSFLVKECIRTARNGGYPVIVKPDVGVGAADTWKLENDEDLEAFFVYKPDMPYVMEEFVVGNIYSYDAICDSKGDPLFENSCWFPPSVADLVNKGLELTYYANATVPEQLKEYGRKALKAFKVRSRFVHFEFFRLTEARKNLGEIGDFVGLEVNMRPAGGYTPDMMDFAHQTDVYQIYADMVTQDKRILPELGGDKYCVYAAKKDIHKYAHSHDEIMQKYGDRIVMAERMPDVLSGAMGNEMYTAIVASEEAVHEFADFVQERAE